MNPQLTQQQINHLKKLEVIKYFKKGQVLLKEHDLIKEYYTVISGCVRAYSLINDEESTLDFYSEDQTINLSINNSEIKSHINLVCEEDCTLNVVNYELEQHVFSHYPELKDICLKNTEALLQQQQKEQILFKGMSPKQRYEHLLATKPNIINRVPHYQIASYLGIKPESLSRLRKRLEQTLNN